MKDAIILTQFVFVAATHPGLVRVVGTFLNPIAGRCSDDTGSVGAQEVRLGAVLRLGDAHHYGFVGAIRTVFYAIASIVLGDAAPVVALELIGSAFGQCCG